MPSAAAAQFALVVNDTHLDAYIAALAARHDSPTVSNPYRGPGGRLRRENLRRYLSLVAAVGPAVALIGEAPGYRGCAVTGIPFTSRRLLGTDVGRWGLFAPAGFVADGRLGGPQAEGTATVVWRHVARLLAAPPVVGNAFPFHPHPPHRRDANRRLTADELTEGSYYLELLFRLFPKVRAVAVGRQAEGALRRLGVARAAAIRHPSQGGAVAFAAGLRQLQAAQSC